MPKPYAELVTQAENAVAAVKDAELRRVAFERVLNDLLGAGDDSGTERSPRVLPRDAKKSSAKPKCRNEGGPRRTLKG